MLPPCRHGDDARGQSASQNFCGGFSHRPARLARADDEDALGVRKIRWSQSAPDGGGRINRAQGRRAQGRQMTSMIGEAWRSERGQRLAMVCTASTAASAGVAWALRTSLSA